MLKFLVKAFRPTPMNAPEKTLPPIPDTAPISKFAQGVASDAQILERIRSHVRALTPPPPYLFRWLLLNAAERVYARKTELLREAAEIKRESDAAMTRVLFSGIKQPAEPAKPLTLLERLQQED